MSNQFTPVDARFWANVYMEPMSGCWLWTGAASKTNGDDTRPHFRLKGGYAIVYRWAYERFVGPIPTGLMVCHHCDVALCVNPAHLFVGTAKDNYHDADRKGRSTRRRYPRLCAEFASKLRTFRKDEIARRARAEE